MAITGSARIAEAVGLRKERKLSVVGEVLVSLGQEVGPDEVIAKTDLVPGGPRIIDVTAELGERLSPEEMEAALQKRGGDKVALQEPLLRHRRGFFAEEKVIPSPCDGTVEIISLTRRRIVIREDPRLATPVSIISAASKLQVWPWTLDLFTVVSEGDHVHAGQVLAAAHSVTGTDYVYAPMAGVIEKIDTKTGMITVVRPVKPSRVRAHLPGVVTEIIPELGAVIESQGAFLEGVFGVGGERYGEIVMASDGPRGRLDEAGVQTSHRDKVLVAGELVTFGALEKARMIGVRGIISGGFNNGDLVRFIGREISVGITGAEDIDTTLIATEGFGPMQMSEEIFGVLAKRSGKIASIDGTTHIRAGARRPQILVTDGPPVPGLAPMPSDDASLSSGDRPPTTNLVLGDRVRCVRRPYLGMWGVVEEVPEAPAKVESEAFMDVAMVKLDDGRVVRVAEANLEVFR